LKIDQSFIRELPASGDQAEVVKTILALARHLRLEAVAEGVENTEQLSCLREFGCEWAQGYLFARAVPLDDAGVLLRRGIETLSKTRISGPVRVRTARRRKKAKAG
jgi:EAL domain-containing protein (putative c-di-GMP-specific phosphodiesterase class I)